MAVLRIEIKVDDVVLEVFELDTSAPGDPIRRYWNLIDVVKARLGSWSFNDVFTKE